MRFIKQNRKLFFLLLSGSVILGFALQSHPASAALSCPGKDYNAAQLEKVIRVSVPIPGVTFQCFDSASTETASHYIEDMGAYIGGLYKFFSGIIGIIAAGMIFYAGVRWMTAGGNRAHVQSAKETIVTSLVAIALVLGSYLILFTINPKLVNLNPPSIQSIVGKEQNFAQCPTSRTCQQGPQEGKNCTQDSDCGAGLSAGVCAWDVQIAGNNPVEFVFNGGDVSPMCGKEYTYTKVGAGSDTCVGVICDTGQVCAPNSRNPSDSVTAGNASCISRKDFCNSISDNLPGIDAGNHDALCQKVSLASEGECRWYEEKFSDDHCQWYPNLRCPSNTRQVNCQENCVANGVACEGKIKIPALFGVVEQDEQGNQTGYANISYPGKCEATYQSTVSSYNDYYSGNEEKPDAVESICCQYIDNPSLFTCLSAGDFFL